jgi:shikimate dehydrogenase
MRLGVIGHPIGHSLSPIMHGAALAALGRADVRYEAIDVPPSELAAFVARRELSGFNVTLPHKRAVLPLLADVDETARAIGAVNTVYRDGERLVGTNTDAAGLVDSLEEEGVALAGARVLVLGAGGAARAAVVGLADAGVSAISVAARREEAAVSLVRELARSSVRLTAHGVDGLRALAPHIDLFVQATSAPLGAEAEVFARALPLDALAPTAVVLDLVYRPRKTAVLRFAEAHGLRTIDGTGMLVHQGARALSRWLGVSAPVDVMKRALDAAL